MITETKSTVNFNFLTQAQYDTALANGNINSDELYFTTDTVIGSSMLPTATTTTLGGVKVGTNLSISNGVLSATNTTYNAATTGTAGLMSASDKSKLDGITASADAISFSQTLTAGTAIGTITINGTGTTLYAPAGSGGSGSSTLSGLTDVTISSATSGQALIYNGSAWVNGQTTGSGGTQIVTASGKTSLQAVTNLTPSYPGSTRGNGAVDLQMYRISTVQIASGPYSVAMGSGNTASGGYSVAMGYSNRASGNYSVVMGYINTASGESSVAMGNVNTASSYISVAMGGNNKASGAGSVAMGSGNTASGVGSVAMGSGSTASGYYSVAMGNGNTTWGSVSVAMGDNNEASGNSSVAMGSTNIASGDYSVAMGYCNTTSASYGATFGMYNNSPFPSVSHTRPNQSYSSGAVAHSGFYGFTMHAGYSGIILNLSDMLFNGVLYIDVVYVYNGSVYSGTRCLHIHNNVIVSDTLSATAGEDNLGFYSINSPFYMNGTGLNSFATSVIVQFGVRYTCLAATSSGGYYYG